MIAGVLLAAGNATRFGSPKLLHPLADGTPIALASARALAAAVDMVVAIIQPEDRALATLLRHAGVPLLAAPPVEAGMGASLAAGVTACQEAEGWVIALADMPYVRIATIARVVDALRNGAPLAAPHHRGKRGHPVGFSAVFRAELIGLTGDHGARHILERERASLAVIDVDDRGVLRDIDTVADLDREPLWENLLARRH